VVSLEHESGFAWGLAELIGLFCGGISLGW
jgi:hypothetical protein